MKRIAFWDNQLCERGTTTVLYDYAFYNQKLLNNKSYIFYNKNSTENKPQIIQKFQTEFTVISVNSFQEVDDHIEELNISHIYIIKFGKLDNIISKKAKNCIHCVFTCYKPHGEVYATIAPWVHGNNGKYPIVPHMINLPNHSNHMRDKLNIPSNATVFGGYGGKKNFDIDFVQETVYEIAHKYTNIYFLFANFDSFCPKLDNIIHLDTIYNLDEKVSFINTCDAMLWARSEGEVMSISMGEFSVRNKPIICINSGYPGHVFLLKNNAIWYKNKEELINILTHFDRNIVKNNDWNCYKEYTPEKVIKIFESVFLLN